MASDLFITILAGICYHCPVSSSYVVWVCVGQSAARFRLESHNSRPRYRLEDSN
jgi:hypothetical protein